MKKTGYWKGFTSALVLMGLVTALGVTATAASKRTIEVEDGIKITINDAKFTPRDADGNKVPVFLYDGTTYVPVRAVCEAAGMDVSFDSATRTVEQTTPDWNLSEDPDAGEYITRSEAKEIALDDAGVKSSDAVFLKAELDWDDGVAHYDVEFYSKGVEYDYEINAKTGKIIESDRDVDGYDAPDWDDYWDDNWSDNDSTSSGSVISREKAQQIAQNKAGSGATVVKCQLDWDDGRQVYELELRNGRMEYECDIDAKSGSILKWEADYDD